MESPSTTPPFIAWIAGRLMSEEICPFSNQPFSNAEILMHYDMTATVQPLAFINALKQFPKEFVAQYMTSEHYNVGCLAVTTLKRYVQKQGITFNAELRTVAATFSKKIGILENSALFFQKHILTNCLNEILVSPP